MPTERFYRLPKEKIEAIREAATREFVRTSYEEASINRVIREADISRGSFYTYFTDKAELMQWLINDQIKGHMRYYVQRMTDNGGDIWDTFENVFQASIDLIEEEDLVDLVSKLINSSVFADFFRVGLNKMSQNSETRLRHMHWLYDHCDRRQCPLDFEGFCDLMEMHTTSLVACLKLLYNQEMTKEKAAESYRRRMDILHYGVCRTYQEET